MNQGFTALLCLALLAGCASTPGKPQKTLLGRNEPGFAVDQAMLVTGPGGQKEVRATVIAPRAESRSLGVAFETFDGEGVPTGSVVARPAFNGGTQAEVAVPVPPGTQGFRFTGAAPVKDQP